MDDNEVNRTIAEFMGHKVHASCTRTGGVFTRIPTEEWNQARNDNVTINIETLLRYTESLDALVPVLDKIKDRYKLDLTISRFGNFAYMGREPSIYRDRLCAENMKTPQQAVAHVTAKAILTLKSNK